jgi:hypothetical protein
MATTTAPTSGSDVQWQQQRAVDCLLCAAALSQTR